MIVRPLLPPTVPILERGDETLQIGVDEAGVLLVGTAADWSYLLRRLDGRRHRDDLCRLAEERHLDPEAASALIDDLAGRGLVVEGGPTISRSGHAPAASVRVLGGGPAGDLGHLVAAEGLGPAPPATLSQVLAAPPDLVVVASAALTIDPMLTAEIRCADLPHLLVHASTAGAVVGPLVIPGVTACLSCMDLRRSDADPGWVQSVPTLQTWTVPWPAGMRAWTLGTTIAEVRRFLSGAPSNGAVSMELSVADYVVRLRHWTPHPECSCRRP
jgi:hypothetical protein